MIIILNTLHANIHCRRLLASLCKAFLLKLQSNAQTSITLINNTLTLLWHQHAGFLPFFVLSREFRFSFVSFTALLIAHEIARLRWHKTTLIDPFTFCVCRLFSGHVVPFTTTIYALWWRATKLRISLNFFLQIHSESRNYLDFFVM